MCLLGMAAGDEEERGGERDAAAVRGALEDGQGRERGTPRGRHQLRSTDLGRRRDRTAALHGRHVPQALARPRPQPLRHPRRLARVPPRAGGCLQRPQVGIVCGLLFGWSWSGLLGNEGPVLLLSMHVAFRVQAARYASTCVHGGGACRLKNVAVQLL